MIVYVDNHMRKRTLGNTERKLPAIGLGCMGLSEFYGLPLEQNEIIGVRAKTRVSRKISPLTPIIVLS